MALSIHENRKASDQCGVARANILETSTETSQNPTENNHNENNTKTYVTLEDNDSAT